MTGLLQRMASLKLTLIGIVGVIAMAFIPNRISGFDTAWVALPLAVLSANLLAAILVNRSFRRQAPLLVFHICLLAVVLLLGAGVLMHMDGRIEIVEGEYFDPAGVVLTDVGRWHPDRLSDLAFAQGTIEVDYQQGLVRQRTRSEILKRDPDGRERRFAAGDSVSATFGDYRFVTTMNKGFTLIVSWSDNAGGIQFGSINFPSYPEFEWKQVQEWTTPDGTPLVLELDFVEQAPRDSAWTLSSRLAPTRVSVREAATGTRSVQPGARIVVGTGTLGIEDVRMWMGYRIDYNPLLPWTFAAAMLALIALAIHFQGAFWPARRSSRSMSSIGPASA